MRSLTRNQKNFALLFMGLISIVAIPLLLILYYPISDDIYFEYQERNTSYESGNVRFYLINSNPDYHSPTSFFKVSIQPAASAYTKCNLDDFEWELRRESDNSLVFSTLSQSGEFKPKRYFENRVDGYIFKGISGDTLGEHSFTVNLTIAPKNECGFGPNQLKFVQKLKLRYRRATAWSRAMSI